MPWKGLRQWSASARSVPAGRFIEMFEMYSSERPHWNNTTQYIHEGILDDRKIPRQNPVNGSEDHS